MNKEPCLEGGFFHHPCSAENCTRDGCIGEGVDLLKRRLGRWYCMPHYKELEKQRANERREMQPAQERQGKLL